MKIFFLFISCIIVSVAHAQQDKINKFCVVDRVTNKPLIASITIVRARLSITTETDGVFIIPGDLKIMTDTIIFSAQNYRELRFPLKALSGMDTLYMSKALLRKMDITSVFFKDTLLNDFENENVGYFAGIHDNEKEFNYLQLAQQFYVDKLNTRLDFIEIDRLAFNINSKYEIVSNSKAQNYVNIEYTKFKVRIYDINPATGRPGKDLCSDIIEIKLTDSEKAKINLKKYNIIIPNKVFFVAIEWMRDYYNAHYTTVVNLKYNKKNFIGYKPSIGISPVTGKKLNIWALDVNQNWIPYSTFSPFGTDLAIKAIVAYH